jgi:tetratricopeptide (TPR) repeat protein
MGIAATVLALLGTVAVAAWWIGLDKRVSDQVTKLYDAKVDPLLTKLRVEGDKTREALVYFSLADRLLNQKNTAEALELYQRVGKLLPDDAQMNYALGRIYNSVGDYEEAIVVLEESHSDDPKTQEKVQKELGKAYRIQGEVLKKDTYYEKAEECLKKAIELNPNESDTFAILGGLYRRKEKYAQAFDFYKRAWRIDPNSSYALGNLASLSWYQGNIDEARVYFGHAEVATRSRIKKGQESIFWAYYDLALAQLAEGKMDEAKKTYAIAIKETPGRSLFDSVLNNLYLLQKAPQSMPGLDEIVKMLEDAKEN